MMRVILVALLTSCVIGTAMAQSCESKAVSAEGKPLHGAAMDPGGCSSVTTAQDQTR